MATERIKADQINPESAADNTVLKVSGGVTTWGFPGAAVALDVLVPVTTSYSAISGDFVLADASTGPITVTLPNSGIGAGGNITVKKMDGTTNFVTVQSAGGVLIDGDTSAVIISQWTSITFIWTGSAYVIKLTARDDPASLGYSGALVRDRQWLPAPSVLSIDEFNNDSLDAAWTRVDNPTGGLGRASWTEGGDGLSVRNEGGDAASELHGMVRPLSGVGGSMAIGDAFQIGITHFGAWGVNYTMGGVLLADGTTYASGNQIYTLCYLNTSGLNNDMRNSTGWNTNPSNVAIYGGIIFNHYFVRIVKTGATTYRGDLSPDAVTWLLGTGTLTNSFTPTQVGMFSSSWGTASKGVVVYTSFRRYSGVS